MKRKVEFLVDGDTQCAVFKTFAEARKAALAAPWANGAVFRTPDGTGGLWQPETLGFRKVFGK